MTQTVEQVMSPTPTVVDARSPIREAAQRMRDEDIGDVLVRKNGGLCGIVTDRDIVVRALAEGRDPDSTSVGDICSQELVAVEPDQPVDEALRIMRDRAVRRLPVIRDGEPVGVVSLGDLAKKGDAESTLTDISSAPPNN
jgi:CBS domain-containing protein